MAEDLTDHLDATDLASRPTAGGTRLLQLLGLAPAEAELRFGLAESTVRSSLKVAFDKFGIATQAELVQPGGRLEVQ